MRPWTGASCGWGAASGSACACSRGVSIRTASLSGGSAGNASRTGGAGSTSALGVSGGRNSGRGDGLDGEDGGVHQVAEIEALHNAYRIVHGDGAAEKNGK